MQFLVNTAIDFMKHRKIFVVLSVIMLVIAVGELVLNGLNLGIDFAGGTQMTVRMREAPTVDSLREQLTAAGLQDPALQRFGEEGDNEVLIKVPVVEGSEEGSTTNILAALDAIFNEGVGFDLNRNGSDAIATRLVAADPDGRRSADSLDPEGELAAHYGTVADNIIAARNERGIFTTWDEVAEADGVSPAVVTLLQSEANFGQFTVLSTESVGPQIGGELQRKGIWAVVFSLVGMLMYIWYRFELRFGVGALVAVFHDFIIVLGLYSLMNFEFNLPTIAAFLTLVGYSVNDTVVIFDRVRENMKRYRRMPLVDVMNKSLNQTLARTLMTSGTTLFAVGSLFVLGGDVIRGFAFVLLVGVVIGTYSSIFVASPFALLWEKWFGREAREKRAAASVTT